MARTDLDIVNQALALLGEEPITAIDAETPNGERVARLYGPQVRDYLLSLHRWVFAAKIGPLARRADVRNPPLPNVYAKPSDLVGTISAFRALADLGSPTVQVVEFGDDVCSRTGPILWAEYTANVPEWKWPPAFAACAVTLLAAHLAWSLQQQRRGSELRAQALGPDFDQGIEGGALLKAKTEDGKSAPERTAFAAYDDGGLVAARRGGFCAGWGQPLGPFAGFDFIPPPKS